MQAANTCFVSGAGLSADSPLPACRGVGELADIEQADERIPIEVAQSSLMLADPMLAGSFSNGGQGER